MGKKFDRKRCMSIPMRTGCTLLLISMAGWGQPELTFQRLATPRHLDLSVDGSRLWYQMGTDWWELPTGKAATPKRATHPITQTRAFRAAVAHGGVYDWIAHYEMRHPLGDNVIAELHSHFATPHEEHFVFIIVMVPWELALELHELHFLSIQFRDDPGPPMLRNERKLFVNGSSYHRLMIPSSCGQDEQHGLPTANTPG